MKSKDGLTVVKTKVPDLMEDIRSNRTSFIGGSDAGAILGLNPYESAYTLWCKKVGLISEEVEDNDALRTGRDLEGYVADRFVEKTGKKVRRDHHRYYLKEYPYMVGHIDRWVIGENAGLECKTANSYQNKEYAAGRYPDHYYAQCQHYMAVTGADKWYLAVLCFPHIYTFEIQRDKAEIEALIRYEAEFWQKVQDQVPPEADGSESTTETIAKLYPKGNDQAIQIYYKNSLAPYFDAKAQIKELEAITASFENDLKTAMGEAERGILGNDIVVSWTTVKSSRLDTKKLKAEHPDLYKEYTRETESRRFSIKKVKKETE